jgi:hypothetical protein
MMIKCIAFSILLLILITISASAQTVTRVGPITPGDCASFSSPNTIQDGGFPCPGSGGTLNLPNGTTATTQSPGDNTTKVATDAFVTGAVALLLVNCSTNQFVVSITAVSAACAQPNFGVGVNLQSGTTYTVQTSDNNKNIRFSGSSPVAVTLFAAASNNPFSFYVKNASTSTVTITTTSGTIGGTASFAVGPAMDIFAVSDGVSNWQVFRFLGAVPDCTGASSALQWTAAAGFACNSALSGGRIKLASPTTFFVDSVAPGVDQVGCGLASGASACRTRGYLVSNVLAPLYDLGGQAVTVQLTGTFTDSLQALIPQLVGQAGAGGLTFTGNCAAGHTSDVVITPAANAGYTYGFAFGFSARIQCQKLDQTTGVRAGQSNDLVVVGQGSKMLMGNPSLLNVRQDMVYGCNINPFNTFTVGPGYAYLEIDNDFTIDVGSCQVAVTGTPTNGSAVIGSIANTTNIVRFMGIVATNVPSDAFVNSIVTNTSVTMACLYTSPCQANGSPGAETITFTGGGQSFIDADSSQAFFTGNGDPSFSIIGTLANFPYYLSGFMFINDTSQSNAQAITWINPGQGRGRCSVVQNISVLNTNFEGLPYFPCNALQPEVAKFSVSLTAGGNTFTASPNTGVVLGQVVTDVINVTGTWTAGSSTMTVSSGTGIAIGAKVQGVGILSGAVVTNVSGTTITVGGCGAGPRCVTGSPLYISEAGASIYFSNNLMTGGSVVTNINGTTITISDTIAATGTAGTLWFQGRVTNGSFYK